MTEDWLPPRAPTHPPDTALPRAAGRMPRRVPALDPARPALRLLTIALLTILVTLALMFILTVVALPSH